MKRSVSVRLGAAVAALALTATACGGSAGSTDKNLTMGVIPGWTDETSTTYLLKDVLEDKGYTVKVQELSDNAPMYTALSNGDIDILSSAWPELTHKTYMDRFGKDIEDIGVYYEGATSFLAVPEYSKLKSIEELPANADEFGGRITGIEPGAGLTKATEEKVIPGYQLDKDFKLVTSSTASMLTELQKSIKAKDEIVVTLWKPFWANLKYPVRALEDPKKAYGEPENLHVLAREDFSDDQPEVAAMLKNFKLDNEQYETLENTVVNDFGEGEEEKAVAAWLKKNPDYRAALEGHLKS